MRIISNKKKTFIEQFLIVDQVFPYDLISLIQLNSSKISFIEYNNSLLKIIRRITVASSRYHRYLTMFIRIKLESITNQRIDSLELDENNPHHNTRESLY